MRSVVTILAAMLMGLVSQPSVLAGEPASAGKPASAAELRELLDQLDDEDFALRERATQRLHAAGERAIDALAEGALSESPEVAWRAGESLKRIAVSGTEQTIDRVADALERVGRHGRSGVVQVVSEIRARQKQLRHDRAAAQIRQLGGGLSGGLAQLGGEVWLDPGFLPAPMPAVELVEVEAPAIAVAVADKAPAEDPPAIEAAEPLPVAPAAELGKVVDDLLDGELSLEHGAGQEIEIDDLDDFRKLVRVPLGAVEPAVEEAPVGVDVAEIIDADFGPLAFPVGEFVIGGGGMFVVDGEEGVAAESLMLDANWRGGDKGLVALRDLPEVTSISIQSARLTDEGLTHIAALPKLSSISIRGTIFSVAALRELHKARPNAYLFCQGEAMVGIHADTGGPCVVTSVYGGSGAADAGLKEGDKIIAIDRVEIRDFSELTISVYGHGVGEKLKIEYEREGQRQTAHVELKARSVLEP